MDFRTKYMGLDLNSPIIVSASTLSEETHRIAEMEDAGAGAVVLFSLFEEQIRAEAAKYASDKETLLWPAVAANQLALPASDYFPQKLQPPPAFGVVWPPLLKFWPPNTFLLVEKFWPLGPLKFWPPKTLDWLDQPLL